MAMESPDARIETALADAENNAFASIAAVQSSLKGAGQEAHDALRVLTERATNLSGTGPSVRQYIDKLLADDSQPTDYRQQMAARIHKAADDRLREDRETLVQQVLPTLEAVLGEASLPVPVKDTGERLLRRQEVERMVSGQTGAALVARMTDLIGRNPSWDAEMLSDHGRALLEQAGVGQEWPNFRKIAIGKLLTSPAGSEKQLANRKALNALRERNLAGHIDGLARIARRRLGDPPASRDAARDMRPR
jgi:hypothetical protein